MRRLKSLGIALAALVLTAALVWAVDPTTFTTLLVTDDLEVADDLTIGGDVEITGDVIFDDLLADDIIVGELIAENIYASGLADFAGAVTCTTTLNVQGAGTADSTWIVAGTFKALTAAFFSMAVVCTTDLDVGGTITGDLTGAVTGNVTGDLTGNVTGNVTGNLTGNVTGNVTGDLAGDVNATIAEVDTLKPGSGTAFFLRAADGQDDADLNCADFSGALTGNVTGNLTGDVTGNVTGDLAGDINATIVEADTLKPGSGTAFYLRASDGQDDADLNCADFSGSLTGSVTGNVTGNLTGDVTGDLTGDVLAAIVITDTLKPTTGKGASFYIRNYNGKDDGNVHCATFTGGLTGAVTGNVTGDLTGDVNATIAEVDTLKPGSGTAFYLRAADGHDDADLNCADFSGSLTGSVTGNVTGNVTGDVTGDLAGDVNAVIVEADTLKPGSGTAFYLRASDGHDDADLNCADFSGNLTGNVTGDVTGDLTGDVNAAIVEADTLKPGSGTAFELRAYDGQDDADLNVYDVSATNDVGGATLTGALVGPACQSVTYQGNLPTNSSGEHIGELFRNTVGDSLWYGDDNAWILLVP